MIAAPVFAADLNMVRKAPPPAPPVAIRPSWTACYLGGQFGYGLGRSEFTDPTGANFAPTGSSVTVKTQGTLFGGQLGCDYQFQPNWVVGIEGDLAAANLKETTTDPFFSQKAGPNSLYAKTNTLGSVTGRIGYAWDRVLFYGRGGAAWSHNDYAVSLAATGLFGPFPPPTNFAASNTRSGWTVGGGIEWAFLPNWSARAELNYYDFGTASLTLASNTGAVIPATIKQQFATVTLGLNYRFGLSGP